MTNPKRQLGNAGEAGIVKRAIEAGLHAMRQPMSGMLRDYPADLTLDNGHLRVLGESKVRSLKVTPSGKRTWTIDFEWLRKVMREAVSAKPDERGRSFDHGALFVRPKGSEDRFVLIDEATYFRLLKKSR